MFIGYDSFLTPCVTIIRSNKKRHGVPWRFAGFLETGRNKKGHGLLFAP
jgi:hypothetical protein